MADARLTRRSTSANPHRARRGRPGGVSPDPGDAERARAC